MFLAMPETRADSVVPDLAGVDIGTLSLACKDLE